MFQPFQYRAIVTKVKWKKLALVNEGAVLDGDSAYFFYDEGERNYTNPNNRFFGIDCPEKNGRHSKFWKDDPDADRIAAEATAFVKDLIEGKEVFCRSMGLDKYGRRLPLIWVTQELADTEDPRKTLNQLLIDKGLAKRAYDKKDLLADKGWGVKVIINGTEHVLEGATLSYEVAVGISGLSGADLYTVTYVRADGSKASGFLTKGESVQVKEGTIVNVSDTSKA
jgi:endonuclease YncB( thermonuclease family)